MHVARGPAAPGVALRWRLGVGLSSGTRHLHPGRSYVRLGERASVRRVSSWHAVVRGSVPLDSLQVAKGGTDGGVYRKSSRSLGRGARPLQRARYRVLR